MGSKRKELNRQLLDAILSRDRQRMQELLEQGADANAVDREHGESALILCVQFGDAAMVHDLIDAGSRINERDDRGRTAIFFAAVGGPVFDVLLRSGADLQTRDSDGTTLLMQKVSACAPVDDVRTLLELGVDPTVRDGGGETAADIAERLGLIAVRDRLVAATRPN
jgi:uncharacterized protein